MLANPPVVGLGLVEGFWPTIHVDRWVDEFFSDDGTMQEEFGEDEHFIGSA